MFSLVKCLHKIIVASKFNFRNVCEFIDTYVYFDAEINIDNKCV